MYKIIVKKESALQISIMLTGFTTLMVQVIFIREFLAILNGNELVSGMVLANWMILTAAGAMLGGRLTGSAGFLIAGQTAMALLPAITLAGVYLTKAVLFPPGTLPGFWESWLFSAMAMLPFCLVSGALFAWFVQSYSNLQIRTMATAVYSFEAAGAVAAGLIFTFILIRIFNSFEILVMLAAANIAAAMSIAVAWQKKRILFHGLFITLLLWVASNALLSPEKVLTSMLHPGQTIRLTENTPYGSLTVTGSQGQLNFFENGVAIFSDGETIRYEESVHYAMLQHDNPLNVLAIAGGLKGTASEVLKYGISQLDYVEINPSLVAAEKELLGFPDDPRVHIIISDPRKYLNQADEAYDVVLLNIPAPSTLQLNRYFSLEFYTALKRNLSPGAVVSVSMGGGSNYLGGESLRFYSIVVRTLGEVFENLLLVPGQGNFLLASDGPVSYDNLSRKEALENQYVNPYYISPDLLEMRGQQLMAQFSGQVPVNRDFRPAAYFTMISHWLSWYDVELLRIIIPLTVIFVLLIIFLRRADKGIFVAGFTASALEIMLLLVFQVVFGLMYQAMALLFAVFMGGLAAGAVLCRRVLTFPGMKAFIVNQLLIGVTVLFVPAIAWGYHQMNAGNLLLAPLIYLFMIISGILTGVHFTLAWQLRPGNVGRAAITYGFDLLGSAGGAMLVAVFMVPVFGLINSGLVLFLLNLITVVMIAISRR